MTVPVPIPTTDGRHFADGLVVMTYVEGGPRAAWGAAVCWDPSGTDQFAVKRLAELRAV